MAKKKDIELDNFEFDPNLDLGDMDFDAPEIKDDRSPTSKIRDAFVGSVKTSAKSPETIRKMVRAAMPHGYGNAMDMADETAGTLKNLYNNTAQEVKPLTKELKRTTKRLMPAAESLLPKRMAERIRKWAESDPDKVSHMLSQAEQRDLQLQAQLGEIFQQQSQQQAVDKAEADAKDQIKLGMEQTRHRDSLTQLDEIRKNTSYQVNYQNKVTSAYQRKSLELQFRQYFVTSDSFEEQKKHNVAVIAQLEGIVKNTGLPDFVKTRSSERLHEVMRNKFIDGVNDSVFSKRRDLMRNLGQSFTTNVKNKARDFADTVRTSLSMGEALAEMQESMAQMGMQQSGGELAADVAGTMAVDSVAGRIGKQGRKLLEKNQKVMRGNNLFQYWTENMPQKMVDWARSDKHENGLFDGVVRAGKDAILSNMNVDTTLTGDNLANMQDPSVVTRQTNKSLTEVIPGYLARIYREIQRLRTGEEDVDLTLYDYSSNRFADKSALKKKLLKQLVGDSDKSATKESIERLIKQLDPDGTKLTPEQRKALGFQLLRDNMASHSADKSRLTDWQTYRGDASQYADDFADLFKDYFKDDENHTRQLAFSREYSGLGRHIADNRRTLQDQANVGNRELLEELGILAPGSNAIDMERLYRYHYDEENPTQGASTASNRRPEAYRMQRRRGDQQRRGSELPPRRAPRLEYTAAPSQYQSTPAPAAAPAPVLAHTQELVQAIQAASSKTTAEAMQETLLRIEKRLNEGFGPRPATVASGDGKTPWWNRTLGQTTQDLMGLGRRGVGKLSQWGKEANANFSLGAKGLWQGAMKGLQWGKDKLLEINDVYLKGEVEPRLTAALLRSGHYRDQATGKVIRSMKDIKGAVVDAQGNIVIKAEEWQRAYMRGGFGQKAMDLAGVIKTKLLGASAFANSGLGLMAKTALSLFSQAKERFQRNPQDVYIKGKTDPVLLARGMREQSYRSVKSQKLIRAPQDIDGAVQDETGNIVLTSEEYLAGIFDKEGKPFGSRLGSTLGGVKSLAKKGFGMIAKAGAAVSDKLAGLWQGMGSLFSGWDLKDGFPIAGGKTQIERLTEIRDLLQERLPKRKKRTVGDVDGDGDRDGSVLDMGLRKKERKVDPAKEAAAGRYRDGNLLGGLKGLFDRFRKKEDDGLDIDIDGGEGKRKPRGKKPVGKAGRFGRFAKATGRGLLTAGKWGGRALLGLGGLGLSAGTALAQGAGTAAMAAGGGLLSLISSPVVLGALAVAGVGAGLYYGYKALTKTPFDTLAKIRYAQYGFLPTDTAHAEALFELEQKVLSRTTMSGATPTIKPTQDDVEDWSKAFGVTPEKAELSRNWVTWFLQRFKPVFLHHVAALQQIKAQVKLGDIASGLSAKEKSDYIQKVKFPGGPYTVFVSPFEDLAQLVADSSTVQSVISNAEAEFGVATPDDAKATPVTNLAQGAAATAVAVAVTDKRDAPLASPLQTLSTHRDTVTTVTGTAVMSSKFAKGEIDSLTAVRYKAYGLNDLGVDKAKVLADLEERITKDTTFANGVARWAGSADRMLQEFGARFGVPGMNNSYATDWYVWFNQRFLPIFLNYATALATTTGKDDLLKASLVLKANQAVEVANAIIATQTSYSGRGMAVWEVPASPWPDYAINQERSSVENNLQALRDKVKSATLIETGSAATQKDANGKVTSTAIPEAKKPEAGFWSKLFGTDKKVTDPTQTQRRGTTLFGGVAPDRSGNPAGGFSGGAVVQESGPGAGGEVNSLPLPQGNGSWAAMKDLIFAAAKAAGVDPQMLAVMAAIESGFNSNAKASTSSAKGLLQFIDETWQGMISRHGKKYGIAPGTSAFDPRANALLGAEFMKGNLTALKSIVKRPVTTTDVYLSHFFGEAGARKFLSADPATIAAQLMPKQAAANPTIFYSKDKRAFSVGEIYSNLTHLISSKAKAFGLQAPAGAPLETTAVEAKAPATVTPAVSASAPTIPVNNQAVGVVPVAAPASATPAAAKAPATPVASPDVAAQAAGEGFVAPRTRDIIAQSQYQKDTTAAMLGSVPGTLEKSLEVQTKQFEVVKKLYEFIIAAKPAVSTEVPKEVAPTPSKPVKEVGRLPVSMAKPTW